MTQEKVAAAFLSQSRSCAALGSPFMEQLMRLCATREWPDTHVTNLVFTWSGDMSSRGDSVPLRMAGALHALRLRDKADLARVYPPDMVDDDTLWASVHASIKAEETFIAGFLLSPPQTNEVRRSAILIAAGHWLAQKYGLPITTSELGASGGLNLRWDQYALRIGDVVFGAEVPALTLAPDWSGPLPPATRPDVIARAGVDLNPLDPTNRDHNLALRAYLWPDQPDRMALTRAAIAASREPVEKDDAIDWLIPRLQPQSGKLHLIYHTIAWQYFPKEKQTAGGAAILAAGRLATDDAPLAWFGMEADDQAKGAALTLRTFPDFKTYHLGRADFHGRWVDWTPPKEKEK